MGMRARVAITTGFLLLLAVAVGMTATQNFLAKYDAAGGLVDSAVHESSGNVGIGTSAPAKRLDVSESNVTPTSSSTFWNGDFGGLRIRNPSSIGNTVAGIQFVSGADAVTGVGGIQETTNRGALGFFTGGSGTGMSVPERLRITSNGNVGIGTAAPQKRLEVSESDGTVVGSTTFWNGTFGGIRVRNPNTAANTVAGIQLMAGADAVAGVAGIQESSNRAALGLFTGGGGVGSTVPERLRIDSNGNVGVGTSNPLSKLHVAGDIRVDGNIAAKYQDVAEWVVSRDRSSAGTVVSIDIDNRNVVRESSQAYDTAIAGVVSLQPGITLGEKGPNKLLVAQSGRVSVKADASFGAIRAGDLLVASSTPGHAMRSQPLDVNNSPFHRPGTILGKALESLPRGKGEILMLLTLQ